MDRGHIIASMLFVVLGLTMAGCPAGPGPVTTPTPATGPQSRPMAGDTRPTPPASRTATNPASGPAVDLHGTKVVAEHVVFLLDASASMADRGLLSSARSDLLKSAGSMDWPQKLNVICFQSEGTEPAFDDLTRASSNNKQALETFLQKLPSKGVSNLIPALKDAFGQLRAQGSQAAGIVVILTDGKFADAKEAGGLLKELNRRRDVRLYIVLEGSPPAEAVVLLVSLAEDNGGKLITASH